MFASAVPQVSATADSVIAALNGKTDPRSRRDLAVLHLLRTLDTPAKSLGRLDLRHVDFERYRIQIPVDNKPTWVHLPPELDNALRAWIEVRGEQPGPLFTKQSGERMNYDALCCLTDRYDLGSPGQLRPSFVLPPSEATSPAEDLFQSYLRDHKRSANTRRLYRNIMNRFADFMRHPSRAAALQHLLSLPGKEANEIAGRFRDLLKAQGNTKNGIATRIAALTGFSRHAKKAGAIGWVISFAASGQPRKNLRDLVTDKIGPIREIQGDGPEAQAARVMCQLEALKPSENSRRAYRQTLRHFAVFLKKSRLEEALAHLLSLPRGKANGLAMEYRVWMTGAKLSAATIAQRLAILRGYCFHAYDAGMIDWRISIRLPRVDSYTDTSGPKPEKIADVLNTLAEQEDNQSKRDCAAIWMLYGMGLRASEVVNLDLAHLDLEGKRVSIKGKMREKREWRTLPDEVMEALRGWLRIRGVESGPLFTGILRGLRLRRESLWRRTTAYGLGRPHGLRHSAISRALDLTNGNYRKVMAFSRHRNPATVIIYDDHRADVGGELAALLAKDAADFGGKAEAIQPAAEKARLTLVHDSVRKLTF